MNKGRLEAFSDGVLAIVITIMVLELKIPHSADWPALRAIIPTFLSYLLSFVFVGLYWNNHHHMLHNAERVSGAIMWANLHLLFWLSLVPFTTGYMGENHFAKLPVGVYGGVLFMAGFAYYLLARMLAWHHGPQSRLAVVLKEDRKGKLSLLIYAVAIGMCFVSARVALGLYTLVAVMWFVPDRRMEPRIPSRTP